MAVVVGPELYGRRCRVVVGNVEYSGVRTTFKISRSTSGKPNQMEIGLYNLAPEHRDQMQEEGLPVRIFAGYENTIALIGSGDLWDARPVRHGPDIVMEIKANDGDRAFRRQLRKSWSAGVAKRDVVKALAEAMGLGLIPASLDLVSGVYQSPRVVSGPASQVLERMTLALDLDWSIQDGQLLLVPRDGSTTERAVVLDAASGLIGSPEIQERRKPTKNGKITRGLVKAQAQLNPLLRPGRGVLLASQLVSGKFRVDVVDHDGDTHDESRWVSSVSLRPVK